MGSTPSWRGRTRHSRGDLVCQYAAEHGATEAVIKVEPENSIGEGGVAGGLAFVQRICEQDGAVFDRTNV